MSRWITPFKQLTPSQTRISNFIVVFILLSFWFLSGSKYIPSPIEVIKTFPDLVFKNDIVDNFLHSIGTCLSALFYSTIISLVACYLSVIPVLRSFLSFLRKFRFLPSAGLSFLFMKLTSSTENAAMAIMVFGVTTWLLDSMLEVALSISDEETIYSRSLRLSRWQMVREILIYGKAGVLFTCVISNFAMAWMLLAAVENITKSSGGLGVVLAESNKTFRMEKVYAIQMLILSTGIGIDYLLTTIRNWIFPWYKN